MNPTRAAAIAFVAVLALATAWPGVARAAWPHDPNIGNVAICTAAEEQRSCTVAPDGAGGAIVTWQDFRSGTERDIYAQRVSAAGAVQWAANGVAVCTATYDQYDPVIVPDGTGGAIIAWQDYRSGLGNDIYAQRVNAAGVVQWTANGIAVCTATNQQFSPVIAPDGSGGAVIAWTDLRGGATYDIYAQRVSPSGAVQWTANGVAVCAAANTQWRAAIASDGVGGAIVTWEDFRGGATYDIYAQRVSAGGTVQWTANGVVLCNAANDQSRPRIVPDAAGGAIVAWYDRRTGTNYDIYAQRVSATGVVLWTANGVALCAATGDQTNPAIASDGSGGAMVAWEDYRSGTNYDVYAQRVSSAGAAQWTANGVALCNAAGNQYQAAIVEDGAGGALVAWQDQRSGVGDDLYAQRVSGAGAAHWTANGVALSTAWNTQEVPVLATDGAGGAIAAWVDTRAPGYDIYAQRVERFGQLGNPEPVIAGVRDVPNDQGGQVRVAWSASYLDADPGNPIADYLVWRQVPAAAALARLRDGTLLLREGEDPAVSRGPALRARALGSQTYYWELVGTQIAQGFAGYSYVAPTASDSVAGSNPRTLFMVEVRSTSLAAHWESAPDSGYSVDNLAPAAPAPFTGTYAAGAAMLHWGASPEADFALYRLYRGAWAGFVPGPGNLVATRPDTGYVDAAGAPFYYKLSAVDVHGNESAHALLLPAGALGVGDGGPRALALAPPVPNPARGEVGIVFGLPSAGRVRLAVYDASGRRVRVLRDQAMEPGEHAVRFRLADDAGRPLPAGLYLLRLEAAGRVIQRRVVAFR